MQRLFDKVAVVLGAAAAGNMGQAIAERLSREGARVVVSGRHRQELESLAMQIKGAACLCDIRHAADLAGLMDFTLQRFGRLDIAVNSAGVALFKPFLDTSEDDLDHMTDVQFKGPFRFIQAAARAMRSGGSIIQIGSITSTLLLPDHAAYMGTKAGIDHVVRAAANDLGERGIRINTICPGLTDTPMNAAAKTIPGFFDLFLPYYPAGRIGTVDDIAAAAVWLASDECFMTGQNLHVEGGLSLRGLPPPAHIRKLSGG